MDKAKAKTNLLVLVVDSSPDYLEAMSNLLATYPCVETIEVARTATEALERIGAAFTSASTSRIPDLVLLDIPLPDGNGLDVARIIKATSSTRQEVAPAGSFISELDSAAPKIVIVTLYDIPAYRAAAISAGADGFLSKADLGERLHSVISDLFPLRCPHAHRQLRLTR
jgi:CheY-like chemotaxis protein